jgi:hypothetical protein
MMILSVTVWRQNVFTKSLLNVYMQKCVKKYYLDDEINKF